MIFKIAQNQTDDTITDKTFKDWIKCHQLLANVKYSEQKAMKLVDSLVAYAKRYN